MKTSMFAALVGITGCGDDGGSPMPDASPVPATLMVTGTAFDIGLSGRTPLAGVTVGAYQEAEPRGAPVATATSDAMGKFTLMITTNGTALDGYLLGQFAGKKDTYLYPTGPVAADLADVPMMVLSQGTFDLAALAANADQLDGMGWVGVLASTAANTPVAGVTVTSSPMGTIRYNGMNGLPNGMPTMTADDGIAYVFNVAPGRVTISASGGGVSFKSHPVVARADQVTMTLIQP